MSVTQKTSTHSKGSSSGGQISIGSQQSINSKSDGVLRKLEEKAAAEKALPVLMNKGEKGVENKKNVIANNRVFPELSASEPHSSTVDNTCNTAVAATSDIEKGTGGSETDDCESTGDGVTTPEKAVDGTITNDVDDNQDEEDNIEAAFPDTVEELEEVLATFNPSVKNGDRDILRRSFAMSRGDEEGSTRRVLGNESLISIVGNPRVVENF